MSVPNGLVKCSVCGDYNGTVRERDLNRERSPIDPNSLIEVSCRWTWIVCTRCGIGKMRRPISNYYDEKDNRVWHSSFITGWMGCESCRDEVRQKANVPRPFEPWKIIPARKIGKLTFTDHSLFQTQGAFILLTTSETGQVINGTIYLLDGGVIAQPQTPEDQNIIEDVLKRTHRVEGTEIALVDDPEAWFRALPAVYNGASFPAMTAIPKYENTKTVL
jgi:hypothetical protein